MNTTTPAARFMKERGEALDRLERLIRNKADDSEYEKAFADVAAVDDKMTTERRSFIAGLSDILTRLSGRRCSYLKGASRKSFGKQCGRLNGAEKSRKVSRRIRIKTGGSLHLYSVRFSPFCSSQQR
jgi:hypothetical protein